MLWKAETSLVVTDRAKAVIAARLAAQEAFPPIAALLLGQDMQTKETAWEVALYDRRVVERPSFEGVLIQTSGLELLMIQSNLVEVINGMQLDWDGGRFKLHRKQP